MFVAGALLFRVDGTGLTVTYHPFRTRVIAFDRVIELDSSSYFIYPTLRPKTPVGRTTGQAQLKPSSSGAENFNNHNEKPLESTMSNYKIKVVTDSSVLMTEDALEGLSVGESE